MLQIILFLIPILLAFISPMGAIAILSYIYVFKIAINTDNVDCVDDGCNVESDPIFGAALPLIIFFIVIVKILFSKKGIINYTIDFADKVFLLLTVTMLVGCMYSPDLYKSLLYFAKFIALGASFYFISKLVLENTDYNKEIQNFIRVIYIMSILMALLGIYYYYVLGNVIRMTIPGSHPIPYSLLIGQGFLVSLAIYFTKGDIIRTSSVTVLTFNIVMIFFLLFSQFLTNTRGVTVAMILASMMMLILNFKKIGFFKVIISMPIGFLIFAYILANMDTDILFARFSNISSDQSLDERGLAYQQGWELLGSNAFTGIGTDSFSFFTSLIYPHNLFLELWVSFGLMGFIIGILFIGILIQYTLKLFSIVGSDVKYQVTHAFMIFFFIETMFSFTLWMHRGFYLSLATVAVLARLLLLEKTNQLKEDVLNTPKIPN